MTNRLFFRRQSSLSQLKKWLTDCSQHLVIVGPPQCGKSFFVKQLQEEADCVAAHFCLSECSESTEAATLMRSIAHQLVDRFPNLYIPNLSTISLLSTTSKCLVDFLRHPLSLLPSTGKLCYVVVDNITPSIYDLVLEISEALPDWIKLVVTSRPLAPGDQYRFRDFHQLLLSEQRDELSKYVSFRLPQCLPSTVITSCEQSWFYVDQLAKSFDRKLLPLTCNPSSVKELMDDMIAALPTRTSVYLALIKASRKPPSLKELIAVSQLIIIDQSLIIRDEIDFVSITFASKDPIILSEPWRQLECGKLEPYHAAWAEILKTKPRKSVQDIVELAYHLAHSGISPLETIRTLMSVGADDVLLRCSVIDMPTTVLLMKAGATMLNTSNEEDFVLLCSSNHLDSVIKLLEVVPDKEIINGLQSSASRGHSQIVHLLLQHMSRKNIVFPLISQAQTLRSAACNNQLEAVDILLDYGIKVDECGIDGRTALRSAAWAGHLDMVNRLLQAGASVNKRDNEQRTPLMAAAFMDNYEIVETFLKTGSNILLQDIDSAGATALHLVLSNGNKSPVHETTVELLLGYGSDVNRSDNHGRISLHLAAFHGDPSIDKIIEGTRNIDSQDSLGRTSLMLAASQGQLSAVQLLIDKGADMDSIDGHGRTALQLAAAGGHAEVVELLLKFGADELHKDNDGAIALHYASVHDDVKLCQSLANSSTINEIDRLGQHSLIIAAQHNNHKILCQFMSLGADVDKLTVDGQTALRVAAMNGHLETIRLLSEWITDWTQRDLDGNPLLHSLIINGQTATAQEIIKCGASHEARDGHGRTAAHVACYLNDILSMRMLQENGASFETVDAEGRTPLMTAVWAGHSDTVLYLLDQLVVNPNTSDEQGATPLSVAAQLGYREIVVLLIRFGAEPSQRDKFGRSPMEVATMAGHIHIAAILQTASGSADSSGFGSMPHSPMSTKSLGRSSIANTHKYSLESPRIARRVL